jgi:hypothetical protein
MTNPPSARFPLLTILLAAAFLCSCQSTTSGPDRPRAKPPATAASSSHAGLDRAYLLTLRNLDEEEKQALEDGRLKELSPAQMRELQDSFESRRRTLKAQWQEASARNAQK